MKLYKFKGQVPIGWRKGWGRSPSGGITEDLAQEGEPRWHRFRYSIPGTTYSFVVSAHGIETSSAEHIDFADVTHLFLPESKEDGDFALLEDILVERLSLVHRGELIHEVFLGLEGEKRSVFNWHSLCDL